MSKKVKVKVKKASINLNFYQPVPSPEIMEQVLSIGFNHTDEVLKQNEAKKEMPEMVSFQLGKTTFPIPAKFAAHIKNLEEEISRLKQTVK